VETHDPNDPNAVLHESRQRFVAGFQAQCDELIALTSASSSETEGARERALRQLHRMVGLAGTLGFMRVSEEAGRLEDELVTNVPNRGAVESGLARLRRAFTEDLSEPASTTRVSPARRPLHVLVVEDDPIQRNVVAAYLRRAGFNVTDVDRGDRVEATVMEVRPDIILLDLDLPGIDGHEVCRRLKANSAVASTPVVFISAENDLNDRIAALSLGADDFLLKPIDPHELLLRLQRLYERVPPSSAGHSGRPMTYEEFRVAANDALRRGPAAVVLVRTPWHARAVALGVLREETRRRDIVAEYDRNHLVLLLPEASGVAARNRFETIVELAAHRGATDMVAGIAASSLGGERTFDSLLEEADDALTTARYQGAAVALKREEPKSDGATAEEGALVVVGDDDPDVIRIVDAHLGAAGFRRVLSFDGASTWQQLQVHRPAVLILDLMMPRMTGFDVLAKIRSGLETPPKILVLSARGREDDVTRAFDLGADDYMSKPFNPHELVARVTRLLR
jgi:two-component system, cell cycle response regulator